MSSAALVRLGNPAILKTIHPATLARLLEPHVEALSARDIDLLGDDPDYVTLARLLADPSATVPVALLEDLYLIEEMATPNGMDRLLHAIDRAADSEKRAQIREELAAHGEATPADVAVLLCVRWRALLERAHVDRLSFRKRKFVYFCAPEKLRAAAQPLTRLRLAQIEDALGPELANLGRSERVTLQASEHDGTHRILLRRGDPFRREGTMEADGSSGIVRFRPEGYDVVLYTPDAGELAINAGQVRLADLYRRVFSDYLFGTADALSDPKYTLAPLRTLSKETLTCADVPGLRRVLLQKLRVVTHVLGATPMTSVHEHEDLVLCAERGLMHIPRVAQIVEAHFEVHVEGARKARKLSIHGSNSASYTRDADAALCERWLRARGLQDAAGRADHDAA